MRQSTAGFPSSVNAPPQRSRLAKIQTYTDTHDNDVCARLGNISLRNFAGLLDEFVRECPEAQAERVSLLDVISSGTISVQKRRVRIATDDLPDEDVEELAAQLAVLAL